MARLRVSELTASRLSLYLRFLAELEAKGVETVSSGAVAEALRLTSSQVRRDLASFGEFGVRGVGYHVKQLRAEVERILGLDRTLRLAIIGAGNLGHALADYPGFSGGGLQVVALFDIDPGKVGGRTRGGIPIFHLDELPATVASGIDVGVVAVPADAAQEVVDGLVALDVRAILNFAPARPRVPSGVRCRSVDLMLELESLSFFLSLRDEEGDATPADGSSKPT